MTTELADPWHWDSSLGVFRRRDVNPNSMSPYIAAARLNALEARVAKLKAALDRLKCDYERMMDGSGEVPGRWRELPGHDDEIQGWLLARRALEDA